MKNKTEVSESISIEKPALKFDESPKVSYYTLSVEGILPQVKKQLEDLPEGDIPVIAELDSVDTKVVGRSTYLFFIKKTGKKSKCKVVDAIGVKELNEKTTPLLAEYGVPMLLSSKVNKRISKKLYLAIFTKE